MTTKTFFKNEINRHYTHTGRVMTGIKFYSCTFDVVVYDENSNIVCAIWIHPIESKMNNVRLEKYKKTCEMMKCNFHIVDVDIFNPTIGLKNIYSIIDKCLEE